MDQTILKDAVEYEVRVGRPNGGEPYGRSRVSSAHLEPFKEEVAWAAQRRELVSVDPSETWTEVEPVFSGRKGRPLERVKIHAGRTDVSPRTPVLTKEYSLDVFREPTAELLKRLVAQKKLKTDDTYEVSVFARAPQPTALALDVDVSVKRSPWLFTETEADMDSWLRQSELLNDSAHNESDTPVFVRRNAWESAREFCRAGGALEDGAMLVGRLFRQRRPKREVFAVIEAAFAWKHAERGTFSLTPSAATFTEFERQLELRRRRLNRPEELILGVAHGHNFLPSLGTDGKPLCPSCPKRSTCELSSAFFSASDREFHRALFSRQVFAVGIVWGLSPRNEDIVKVFTFRCGALEERSIWLVEPLEGKEERDDHAD